MKDRGDQTCTLCLHLLASSSHYSRRTMQPLKEERKNKSIPSENEKADSYDFLIYYIYLLSYLSSLMNYLHACILNVSFMICLALCACLCIYCSMFLCDFNGFLACSTFFLHFGQLWLSHLVFIKRDKYYKC